MVVPIFIIAAGGVKENVRGKCNPCMLALESSLDPLCSSKDSFRFVYLLIGLALMNHMPLGGFYFTVVEEKVPVCLDF